MNYDWLLCFLILFLGLGQFIFALWGSGASMSFQEALERRKPVSATCKMHVGNYLMSTLDFSALHHGMYLLLVHAALVDKGELPNNDKFLAWVTKSTVRQWRKNKHMMERFFEVTDREWILKADHIAAVRLIFEDDGRLPQAEWSILRAKIFERDDFTCTYCGAKNIALECDHVMPVSRGGSNDETNLTTACQACNRKKRAKTVEEWRAMQ